MPPRTASGPSGRSATEFLIEPAVVCGKCGSFMDIEEWWVVENAELNDGRTVRALPVPHPDRGHPCKTCGEYWMPESGAPGDQMDYIEGVLVFS